MAVSTCVTSICRTRPRLMGLVVLLAVGWMQSVGIARLATSRVIEPPEHMAFSTNGKWLDVSPDGRRLVVVVDRPTGERLLWVHDLDSQTAFPLAGTEEATSPFWSPDSRIVGFFARGQLSLIDVISGDRRTLCTCGAGFGATWNRGGVIIFSQRTGLWRVSAIGGSPSALTSLDPTHEEVVHAWPQFLPDGRRFVYRIRSRVRRYTGIYLGSLECPSIARRLVGADSNPMYSGGHLFFGRQGTLFAQALDLDRARLIGNPVPVVTSIMQNPESGQLGGAVADSGLLAYRSAGLQRLV